MQIPIHKDLEEAYKDEFFKGFTMSETLGIIISVAVIIGMTALIYIKTGISPESAVYTGLPFGLPIIYLSFKKFQGLSTIAYLKEIIYEYRTRRLTYDADELPEDCKVFTMERRSTKSWRWR